MRLAAVGEALSFALEPRKEIRERIHLFITAIVSGLREDQVLTSGEEYELRCKDPAANAKKPRAFVFPESRDEVQRTVKLAFELGTKNWGYLNTSNDRWHRRARVADLRVAMQRRRV
jgi:hypothetical protein